jgi:hypothetical protein
MQKKIETNYADAGDYRPKIEEKKEEIDTEEDPLHEEENENYFTGNPAPSNNNICKKILKLIIIS